MIVETAKAKLNLALHVRARRADGYHELETLFAFVEHGDIVSATRAEADSFMLAGPFAGVLAGEGGNLVTRAAAEFAREFGHGAHAITLDKRLPVASGIGGGSADAAATLRALARRHDVAADDSRLFDIAARLGADVPACLLGKSAIGEGRGDELRTVAGLTGRGVLLVNPRIAVSTARVFAGWDGIDRGPIAEDPAQGRNDLTAPAISAAPEIADVLDALDALAGARLVRMSGSGASCFALFDTPADARSAAAEIGAEHRGWWALASELA